MDYIFLNVLKDHGFVVEQVGSGSSPCDFSVGASNPFISSFLGLGWAWGYIRREDRIGLFFGLDSIWVLYQNHLSHLFIPPFFV